MFKKKKVYAYENSDGDKGIIIAKSYKDAAKIFYEEYPDRKIMDPSNIDDNYWDDGAYLLEAGTVNIKTMYIQGDGGLFHGMGN